MMGTLLGTVLSWAHAALLFLLGRKALTHD